MKSFDVKELGLEELSPKDAKKVNGGWWILIPIAIGCLCLYGDSRD